MIIDDYLAPCCFTRTYYPRFMYTPYHEAVASHYAKRDHSTHTHQMERHDDEQDMKLEDDDDNEGLNIEALIHKYGLKRLQNSLAASSSSSSSSSSTSSSSSSQVSVAFEIE